MWTVRHRMEGTRTCVLLAVAVCLQAALGINNYDGQWRNVVRTANANHRLGDRGTRNMPLDGSSDPLTNVEFNCPKLGKSPNGPKSVHELRPSDINVLTAMGDSITAGYGLGAESVVEVLVKNRGESWSIGGDKSLDEGILTLTNLMRKYNSNVTGFSVGAKWVSEEEAGFNVAFGGHQARDMPTDAHTLIERLQQSNDEGHIDYQKDWKLTTLLIGGNDMCDYCLDRKLRSPENYAENIMKALDLLQQHVPRMLVQVVVMFDISSLRLLQDGYLCAVLQEKMCECALESETRRELRPLQVQYYEALKQLIEESGRYDQKDDFTVVLQPFMRDWRPPMNAHRQIDRTYFSPDCFHPGRKMHRSMAYMLWNNMFIPVGQKPLQYDYMNNLRYSCPTEDAPFIYTNKNSKSK